MRNHNGDVSGVTRPRAALRDDRGADGTDGVVLVFGPFRLDVVRHDLRAAGKPVRLGSRALEILLALVERAGETIGTNELLARVWRNSVVEPCTVRVHIASLRKILGDGKSDVRYIENVSGQGYRFAVPVTRLHETGDVTRASSASFAAAPGSLAFRSNNLPTPLTRMLGRAEALSTLVARMPQRRFVTLTGPGGIGKTMLAVNAAEWLAPAFPHGVCFVDLASVPEPRLLQGALAEALGLAARVADPLPDILTFLRDKSMLVVFDNCEHVIEAAARLVESVLQGAPGVHVLATSREPLRAQSEVVHRLEGLALPVGGGAMTGAAALAFPAIQLFVERAEASLDTFELRDAEVPILVEICRRLDGNPLALELVAANVDLLGIRGLAVRVAQELHLTIRGRRTAAPRQKTLGATLDWSYGLLPASEQALLRRVAVFINSFDLPAARAVATDEKLAAAEVPAALTNLVAKSLLVADGSGERARYRLPATSRAYALKKLRDSEELAQTQGRHAEMCSPAVGSIWRAAAYAG